MNKAEQTIDYNDILIKNFTIIIRLYRRMVLLAQGVMQKGVST